MVTISPTTTTIGGVTTSAQSTPDFSTRYNLLGSQTNAFRKYFRQVNKMDLSSVVSGYALDTKKATLLNKTLDDFLASTKKSTLGENDADYVSPLGTGTTSPIDTLLAPTEPTTVESGLPPETIDTSLGTQDEITQPDNLNNEQKKQESLLSGNTNVPTVNFPLGNTNPQSGLPTSPKPAPTVPTKDDTNNSEEVKDVLRKRRGRASTIGLGQRGDINLSSSIVKLLGV